MMLAHQGYQESGAERSPWEKYGEFLLSSEKKEEAHLLVKARNNYHKERSMLPLCSVNWNTNMVI